MNLKLLQLIPFLIILILASCAPSTTEEPTDLPGLQNLLSEKKKELIDLKKEVEDLQDKVDSRMPKVENKVYDIYAFDLEKRNFESYVKLQGSVMSDDYVSASSETGGRILSLAVNEGDYVSRGQFIASMDLVTLEKQLAELETAYSLAKTVYERQERLWQQNIGSEIQYLEAKNGKERLEKSMETIQSQLAKQNVVAPISGYVDRVNLKQGEMASPGMPIVQILNTGSIKIVADLPETYLQSVKQGDYVEVFFPALDQTMKKKISMVGRTINPANRTFKVEMKSSNPSNMLKPNLLAEITVRDKFIRDVVVIPLNIIRREVTGQQFVYAVKEDGDQTIATKMYIEIGDSYENDIIVTSGLDGTELLIDGGIENLSDGAAVSIKERIIKDSDE